MTFDRILLSNATFTGLDDDAAAAAVALSGDRIAAVGPLDQVLAQADDPDEAARRIEDLGDAFLCPGFHDSHMHVFHSALYSSPLACTFMGRSEQDCVERLRAFAETRPSGWLLAQGWREYRWDPPRLPDKRSLDAAFPRRPVALYSGDAHSLWLNSCALEELGLTDGSLPPAGGVYDRDGQGHLTGIVREAAAMELMPRITASFTDEELDDAYASLFRTLAARGITGLCDLSLMAGPGLDFVRDDIYERLLGSGRMTARVTLFPTLTDDQGRYDGLERRLRDPMLSVGGFKQFFDGVSSQHTAWIHDPYSNATAPGERGRPTIEPAVMRRYVMEAARRGRAVRIHAIGDEAIHQALDIFQEARGRFGPLPGAKRHCIEHLENFQPADMRRLAKLDVVAAVQPPHITLDPGGPERDLGVARARYMWPFATLLGLGATLAFGTDSPVVDPSPAAVLYCAVARQDPSTGEPVGGWQPQERIGRVQALSAYTRGSALAAGRGDELGLIAPGMLADLVAIDRSLLSCTDDELLDFQVLETIVGGKTVYRRDGDAS
uniref:Amidohydrolase n=1 Tax=Muribaculaceae bacterium Z82 TaxID=2304548 RepID=A0A7C9KAR0_9BACT